MKKILLIVLIVLTFIFQNECFAVENQANKSIKNGILFLQINKLRPDGINEKKYAAYCILKPYLSAKLTKAAVIWQEDEFSYGVEVAVSKSYISQYLRKRISKASFIEKFQINYIDPNDKLVKNVKIQTSSENARQAMLLRENADIFRHHNDLDAALRTHLQALEYNEADCISLYRIAEIYDLLGQSKLSIEYCSKIEQYNPEFANWVRSQIIK